MSKKNQESEAHDAAWAEEKLSESGYSPANATLIGHDQGLGNFVFGYSTYFLIVYSDGRVERSEANRGSEMHTV